MRIRSDYGSGFKSKSEIQYLDVNFKICFSADPDPFKMDLDPGLNSKILLAKHCFIYCGSGSAKYGFGSLLLFLIMRLEVLTFLLSKLNFKPKSFKHSKSSVLARVRGCVRACAVACACARLRARVHGRVRACVLASLRTCVCATRVRTPI